MARVLAICKNCNQYSDAKEVEISGILSNMVRTECFEKYPSLPSRYLDDLSEVIHKLTGFISIDRSEVQDMLYDIRSKMILDYYSNWPVYLKAPNKWMQANLNTISALSTLAPNPIAFNNVLEREIKKLSESGSGEEIIELSVLKKRTLLKRILTWLGLE